MTILSRYTFEMDCNTSLLSELDRNVKAVVDLADETVARIHTPLLGLLIGDVSPIVVWKMLYLSHTCPDLEERCTMLSVVTDYISNTPSVLQAPQDRKDTHSPTHLIRVLGEIWCVALPNAKKGLTTDAFLKFALALGRCFTGLSSYHLQTGLASAMQVSADLRAPQDKAELKSTSIIDFPRMALISSTKLRQIRPLPKTNRRRIKFVRMTDLVDDAPLRQITNMPEHSATITPRSHRILEMPTRQIANTAGNPLLGAPSSQISNTPGHRLLGTPSRQISNTPRHRLLGTPSRHISNTPGHRLLGTPSRHISNTPGHQILSTPYRQIANTPGHQILATPPRQISNTPGNQLLDTPTRQILHTSGLKDQTLSTPSHEVTNTSGQELQTPTSKTNIPVFESISLHGTSSRSKVTPTQRRLIHAELTRLHVLRSSPAMPLHLVSDKNNRTVQGTPSSLPQLQASVHRASANSSFHPIEKRVMKELYF